MKKKILASLLAALMIVSAASPAYAEHYKGSEDWKVTITAEGQMVSNFTSSDVEKLAAQNIQPGDDITVQITVVNEHADSVNLYMSNKVLQSMEDSAKASNGAYTYTLKYAGATANDTIYDSDTVGGEDVYKAAEGLHGATSSLEDYFLLETLPTGKSGAVTLFVSLDGESQGNSYQNAFADLQINFAAEILSTVTPPPPVKTGDETNLLPLYIAMGVSGAVLLGAAFWMVSKRRKEDAA